MKRPTREKPPATAQTSPFSSKSKPNPRRSPPVRVNSQDPSPPAPDAASPDTYHSVFSFADRNLSNSSRSESHILESDPPVDKFEPPPREWTIPEMKLVSFREPPKPRQLATISIFSLLPYLRFHSIPRPLRMSLSLLNPEHLQISDTTSSELDLALCVFLPSGVMSRCYHS